ncbi:hypothetical protein [Zunongwangia sp. HRR-M8]|uniref:hypothetical protein n=1 Tax=Zunongwangia sp. HRR-M8 TaxID=3015170 RepID=UPI0022DD30CD|nr:hypothetical protein [Zunongwangia sp. HRR-M8]WBL22733.1 hypothetical protein PBT89_01950 [Zunongwangia sp. HRR-M8]
MLLLLGILFSCDEHHSENQSNDEDSPNSAESQSETKEEKLVDLYKVSVIPLFKDIPDVNPPVEIEINTEDLNIDAGAASGYLDVSQGLVDLENEAIQIFALAHEVAHMATIPQAKIFNLAETIPKGNVTNDYQKAEYLADLMAVHLIHLKLPETFELIQNDFETLQEILGAETFTHPSGENRILSMKLYIDDCSSKEEIKAFEQRFETIWTMN